MTQVRLQRDPEKTRRTIGIVLYVLGMLIGGFLLVAVLFFPAMLSKHADVEMEGLALGALFALPMLVVYLWVPWIVDRYDPEPWWALLMALAWGAIAACGFSALVNTVVDVTATEVLGKEAGEVLSACISAPIVEEGTKAMAVFFMFYFMRREFDGVVDGVIYATFSALGFAAVENILYYGNAAATEILQHKEGAFIGTFVVRGILGPWGHPLYTSMTGLGFGIARETNKTWLKWMAPIGGYCFAMFLHATWNTAATLSGDLVALMLPLWFLFVLCFFGLVIYLVARKGRIIRDHLKDEVPHGQHDADGARARRLADRPHPGDVLLRRLRRAALHRRRGAPRAQQVAHGPRHPGPQAHRERGHESSRSARSSRGSGWRSRESSVVPSRSRCRGRRASRRRGSRSDRSRRSTRSSGVPRALPALRGAENVNVHVRERERKT